MLVLTRKEGETIVIGSSPSITIKIVDIDRGKVRVGIEAPLEIQIWRGEIAPDAEGSELKED